MKIGLAFVAGLLVAGLFAFLLRSPSEPAAPAVTQAVVAPVAPAETAPPAPVAEPAPAPREPVAAPVEPKRPVERPKAASARPAAPAPRIETPAPAPAPPEPKETPQPVAVAKAEPEKPAAEPENPYKHTAERLSPPIQQPGFVTIDAGTLVTVRLSESLSSETAKSGDTFKGVLDKPLIVDGFVVAERGGPVEGRVVQANPAGRVKGVSFLRVELSRLQTADGQWINVNTETFEREGEKSARQDAAKVGAAAGIAAAIGAIAGGGKGAAIGAAVGGAAGAGAVLPDRPPRAPGAGGGLPPRGSFHAPPPPAPGGP
ncbi:MAG TPA: hypothetical protein DEH78_11050, partial [Solibacterales bacterium]|nr:hypothetical protein [Bryobacterales bacterium]